MNINAMAALIYRECFGHLDDKRYRSIKEQEIADWLAEGDLDGRETLPALVAEWREYDAENPNIK